MLRIKEICKEKGMTLQELAKALNITYQSLSESIKGNPTLLRLYEIAKALDVDIVELFDTYVSDGHTCPHCGKPLKIQIQKYEVSK